MLKVLIICSFFLNFCVQAAPEKLPEACFKKVFTKLKDDFSWKLLRCSQKGQEHFKADLAKGSKNLQTYEFSIKDASPVVDISYDLLASSILKIDFVHERGGEVYLIHPVESKKLYGFNFRYKGSEESTLELKVVGDKIEGKTDADLFKFDITKTGEIKREEPIIGRRCALKEKDKKGKRAYELVIHKQGEEVVGVSYKGSSESGKIGGAYFCDFQMTVEDPSAKFSRVGNVTTIKFKSLDRKSEIIITDDKSGYAAEFKEISQFNYCGAGAQIPAKISLKNKKCKVE